MSQETVERVRRTIEVANRRELDALDDIATADYEWHNSPGLPGGGVYPGTGSGQGAPARLPRHVGDVQARRSPRDRRRGARRAAVSAPREGKGRRCAAGRAHRLRPYLPWREVRADHGLPSARRGPRSRWAAGVGEATSGPDCLARRGLGLESAFRSELEKGVTSGLQAEGPGARRGGGIRGELRHGHGDDCLPCATERAVGAPAG